MPLWPYRCFQCGREFELLASLADRRETALCRGCGWLATRQISAHAGFTFAERKESRVSRAIRKVKENERRIDHQERHAKPDPVTTVADQGEKVQYRTDKGI